MTRNAVYRAIGIGIILSGAARAGKFDKENSRPHLVIVMAESEYHTDQTLPLFAKANLAEDFRISGH